LLSDALPGRLQSLQCAAFEAHGFRALAVRASDTGEDGFELVVAPAVAQHLVDTFAGEGIPVAGWRAQEIARVEACIPAYEPDLATGLTPAEADLDVLLGVPGGSSERTLAAVIIDGDALLAAGTPIMSGDTVTGELRSCVRSLSLDAIIGLAVIKQEAARPGARLQIAGTPLTVVSKPFFRRRSAS